MVPRGRYNAPPRQRRSAGGVILRCGQARLGGLDLGLIPASVVTPNATPRFFERRQFEIFARKQLILLVGAQGLEPWTR
jgi:hypothetical protein